MGYVPPMKTAIQILVVGIILMSVGITGMILCFSPFYYNLTHDTKDLEVADWQINFGIPTIIFVVCSVIPTPTGFFLIMSAFHIVSVIREKRAEGK